MADLSLLSLCINKTGEWQNKSIDFRITNSFSTRHQKAPRYKDIF